MIYKANGNRKQTEAGFKPKLDEMRLPSWYGD